MSMPWRMTPRQRVLAALAHRPSDRVPIEYHFFGTPEMLAKLRAALGYESNEQLLRRFGVDIRRVAPAYVGPPLSRGSDGTREDMWGVRRMPVSHGTGVYQEICHYPLARAQGVEDLERHRWPQVDWLDYASLAPQVERLNQREQYAIILGNGNIFETAWYLRGLEQMLVDCLVRPAFVAALLRRIADFYIAYFTAALTEARGLIDVAFTADDVATQRGPLLSLELWRRLLKPEHARLNRTLHDLGVPVVYHSDGAIAPFLDDFVEMGIDALDPVQLSADGMDPAELKARARGRLCFHGGVDVQATLPFGTPEQVRRRSRELIATLGQGGGYIFGPAHAIQEDTPVENVLAMFDTALDG
jgi:uroporphyrinogen decarboxylase